MWGAASKDMLRVWLTHAYVEESMPAPKPGDTVRARWSDYLRYGGWRRLPHAALQPQPITPEASVLHNKSKGPALIIIAWALASGQIVLVRVSELRLVQLHGDGLRIFWTNTYIVADKGFTSTQSCYPNGNPVVCPATKGSSVDVPVFCHAFEGFAR